MKILIIDNNMDRDCWGSSDLCRMAAASPGVTIQVRRGPHGDLPKNPNGFDRVIVSGSRTSSLADAPWIDQLLDFIKRTIDARKPYLGVCYGHQSLIRAVGGKALLTKAAQPEFGWSQIVLSEESALTKGLPKKFFSFSAHFEEAAQLPKQMRRLASSEDCAIQACQLADQPVFGIQFHPEKSVAEAKKVLAERKKEGTPRVLLHPQKSEQLYDPKVGETIFRNFLQI